VRRSVQWRRVVGWVLPALVLVSVASADLRAVELDGVTITLHSQQYYWQWDMTRLVYRVKSRKRPRDEYWALQLDACISDETIWWTTPWFEWIDEPFRGILFERSSKNEKFYVWLDGQWDVGTVDVAVLELDHGDFENVHVGEIDGPLCAGGSLSLEVLDGETVAFDELSGAGRYPAESETRLRVTSTSAGWALSHDLSYDVPDQASIETVSRIVQVMVEPFDAGDGATDVSVAYALDVADADFAGLPEGAYVIRITFTVSTD